MSGLLKEIEDIDGPAADELREAGLQSDSDIQALTEGDLRELLPGKENIKRRRNISDIIHKQPIDRILKELKPFIPEESMRDALTDDGVLVNYLGHLMDMKTQMIKNRTAIEAHIDSLKELKTNPSDQESDSSQVDKMDTSSGETDGSWEILQSSQSEPGVLAAAGSSPHSSSFDRGDEKGSQSSAQTPKRRRTVSTEEQKTQSEPRPHAAAGEVISGLLKEIERIDGPAADELREAGLQSDSDIQALTEGDLRELLPGKENIKRRRNISDIIHKQPIDRIPKELKPFIPEASMRAALTDDGVLVNYLGHLMDMKTQMDEVLTIIEAHISLLNKYKMDTSSGEPDGSWLCTLNDYFLSFLYGLPAAAAGAKSMLGSMLGSQSTDQLPKQPVSYRMVVSGKTFDAHLTLMEEIKKQVQNQLHEDKDDNSVTFVFCPISSRVASDVEAAMSDVTDGKPVILVLMHHTHQVRVTSTMRTWNVGADVVLCVNVFYHESCGLLQCDENNAAVTEIGNKLLERFILKSLHTSGNAEGGRTEGGGRTVSTEEQKTQREPRPHAAAAASKDQRRRSLHEDRTNPQSQTRLYGGTGSGSRVGPPPSGGPNDLQSSQSESGLPAAASSSPHSGSFYSRDEKGSQSTGQPPKQPTLYRMVVGGKTFDAHRTLMEKIKKQVQNLLYEDKADNHSVTFVFCPISSGVASDVEAAMSGVTDGKPVILVLMHHTHQVRVTSAMRTWNVGANVVLHVNVFYHETRGLLRCDENNAAVTEIRNELLKRFIPKSSLTSENTQSGGGQKWWEWSKKKN